MRKKAKINVKRVVKNMILQINENKRKSQPLNEQIAAAAAGFVALISAAGGMAALQMKMEDEEYKKKHPKLATFLEIMGELGSAASKARTSEQEGGDDQVDDSELQDIEDELQDIFDIPCAVPGQGGSEPEAEPIQESRSRRNKRKKTYFSSLLLNEVKNKLRKPRKR
jgi:NTP pyrophosphatase (non-canonical NTP hydrolase)